MTGIARIHCGWLMTLVAMAIVCGAPVANAADSTADIVESAASALKAGEFDRAVELYEQAREQMPSNSAIAYNLGVAHYRKGDYQRAAQAFSDAASLANDGSLRSRSIYNLGNAAYAQSLAALKSGEDSAMPQDQLQQATDMLKEALDNYKRAITSNPQDEDARANAELSHKFLKQLQELQQLMQQQQNQSQNQQSQQEQQQQQQQQQNQSQQSQGGDDQQQHQQASSAEQSQRQEQQDQSDFQQDQSQSADQPQQEQEQLQSEIEPIDEQSPDDKGRRVQHSTNEKDKKSMTRQEAERLLQSVRDKERKRRMDLLRREAAKYAPAEKDW